MNGKMIFIGAVLFLCLVIFTIDRVFHYGPLSACDTANATKSIAISEDYVDYEFNNGFTSKGTTTPIRLYKGDTAVVYDSKDCSHSFRLNSVSQKSAKFLYTSGCGLSMKAKKECKFQVLKK
jgi:hypothetical protein